MAKKILFVLTSAATMGDSDKPTGLWLEDFTEPYYALRDGGYDIDVVSIAGGKVPLDPASLGGDETPQSDQRFNEDPQARGILENTRSVDQVDFGAYDAVFLPGGHGTMWDLPGSAALARGVEQLYAAGKPVAAVCHGPAGLVSAKGPDGRPLVAGKRVSAFTEAEEDAVKLKDKIPFLLDQRLRELGAEVVEAPPFQEMAVADGHLITGQNPQSAAKTAELLMGLLKG
jgi:putative intracellular protease/amidase